MKIAKEDIATSCIFVGIVILGVVIRGISLILNGPTTLLDLDPYHILRAVQAIMNSGHLPGFDPLSSAPTGTNNTFMTSQGYYYLIAELALLSGVSSSEALAISPVIAFPIELMLLFAITYSVSHSRAASLVTSFLAVCLKGWSAISVLGGDPVAENIGVDIFLIVMLLSLIVYERQSTIAVGLLAFLDGVSVEIHPVTYFFINLVLGAIIISLIVQKEWRRASHLVVALILSTFGIELLSMSGASIFSVQTFSSGAFWLANLQPFVFTINDSILLSEVGLVTILLASLCIILTIVQKEKKQYFLLAWAAVLYAVILVGLFSVSSPDGTLIQRIPFYGPIVLSHRVMPYLPPCLVILSGAFLGVFVIPHVAKLRGYGPQIAVLLAVLIALASAPQLISVYQFTTSYATGENIAYQTAYVQLYQWIDKNTRNGSIFVVNDLGFGEYIKAISSRPVVFTTSEEDLAVRDFAQRALLQTCVFLNMCSLNNTLSLLKEYHVQYAVVVNPAMMVNQNTSSFVYFNENSLSMQGYLNWFLSRPVFTLAYNNSAVYVFQIQGS